MQEKSFISNFLPNLTSAIVVSFLTIAAGSAFGVLTGLGAQAGIISMVFASLFGWIFGGIKVKASGPTGPTASVMLSSIIAIKAIGIPLESVFVILATSGVVLILLGFLPLQKFATVIPNVATAVFINGVAVIILENQIRKVYNFHALDITTKWWDTGFALGSLVFLILWPKILKPYEMSKLGKLLSGSLMVMLLGGLINFSFNQQSHGIMTGSKLFADGFPLTLDLFSQIPLGLLAISSLKIAFIIFFVTIVSVRALIPKGANYKAELYNIGFANVAVASVGGLASSIGFVRSKILQNNGGNSQWAGILTALLVFALLIFAQPLLTNIPVAVFIGILIKAVWGSMDWQFLHDFIKLPKYHAITFFTVLLGSVSMIWFDQSVVVIIASGLWLMLSKIPSLSEKCTDIEQCPIARHDTNQ